MNLVLQVFAIGEHAQEVIFSRTTISKLVSLSKFSKDNSWRSNLSGEKNSIKMFSLKILKSSSVLELEGSVEFFSPGSRVQEPSML